MGRVPNSITHNHPVPKDALEKLNLYPIRFAFLSRSDDAGNDMSETLNITNIARPPDAV